MNKIEFDSLKSADLYSVLLFALYKLKEDEEYSTISELAYVLDKNSLLSLCEYFGGMTIKIPTINELQTVLHTLMLYSEVNLNKKSLEESLLAMNLDAKEKHRTIQSYSKLEKILKDYSFGQTINSN